MSLDLVKDIADAVLFEGYILYPYRPSSIKNQQRWTFGGVFPADYAGDEPSVMQTEMLLTAGAKSTVDVTLRFLHTQRRQLRDAIDECVGALDAGGRRYVTWDEAVVRELTLPELSVTDLALKPRSLELYFDADREVEQIRSDAGELIGSIVRTCEAIEATLEVSARRLDDLVYRLRVTIRNTAPIRSDLSRAEAQLHAMLSTHTILRARDAEFISLIDPPEAFAARAAACENIGTWPVLAGLQPARDIILSSPIILYDYPRIAPESKGQFFDGTEIDEMLTLRVLTLTDEEKREMAATDPRTRSILERCQAFSRDDLYDLHGAFRDPADARKDFETPLAIGTHVRINPKPRGDVFDIALKDKIGVVQAIERDFEDRVHVAVTLLDDPGGDLGQMGFPGHRFFFSMEEVALVDVGAER